RTCWCTARSSMRSAAAGARTSTARARWRPWRCSAPSASAAPTRPSARWTSATARPGWSSTWAASSTAPSAACPASACSSSSTSPRSTAWSTSPSCPTTFTTSTRCARPSPASAWVASSASATGSASSCSRPAWRSARSTSAWPGSANATSNPCRRAASRRSGPRRSIERRDWDDQPAAVEERLGIRGSRFGFESVESPACTAFPDPQSLIPNPESPRMSKQNQWIVGINAVAAAVEHDSEHVREVLIEAGAKNPRLAEIEQLARRRDIDVRRVAQQALAGVAGATRHQGVAARYAAAKTWDEHDLEELVEQAGGRALLLVLDGVQDPHNLGACLRSAAAAGATAVVIPKDKAVQVNATVRKTSAGAADSIPVARVTNLSRTLAELQKQGVWIYGLVGDAGASLYALDLKGNVALVLGGEADGLRRLTREHCDQLVSIPMPGIETSPGVESLNVSVAAGVTLFEAVRQRGS